MGLTEEAPGVVEQLVNGYSLEAEIYARLLEISRRQGELLEKDGDLDLCAQLFGEKDELLRAITTIEAELEPLKRKWWSQDIPPASRDHLNHILDTVLATIEQLMAQEQRNEQLLLDHHERVQEELGQVQRGAEMQRSHNDQEPLPRFMDVRR